MGVPDYQAIMLPLLQLAADGKDHNFRDAVEELSVHFRLSATDRAEMLPSGKQATFDNRVGWARTYLTKAMLLESPKRGLFRITDRGRQVLGRKPKEINVHFLQQFKEFQAFRRLRREKSYAAEGSPVDKKTPEESLETAYQSLREDLADELLNAVRNCTPRFFERLVVDLLVKMGYGGSRKEAGQAVGQSGDGGIDGIIKEDRLGLDIIYVQAKRWENTVGRPEIQKFAGALQGQRARKGIFLTTSTFSRDALEYVTNIETKIILIDGERLAEFMIDNNVGVTPEAVYEVKRIDTDYFVDE
jgi:restriction system protein